MMFSYDKFSQLEKPTITLAKPDKTYIGFLQGYDLKTDLYFNSISQATFTVYKYKNGRKSKCYDDIEVLKLLEIKYIGWFQITQINVVGDGDSERKEITAMSLENELCNVLLHAFGEMGTKSDEEGGQDMYCLYNIMDKEHSILHLVMDKMPTWSVGHVDVDLTTEYHSFNNDSVDAYSFLTSDVATSFECIFQFDTFDKKISAYKLENLGKDTSIFLSYRNLINEIQIDEDSNNIKTVMNVIGGDYNGHPLVIADVNPTGSNDICNFTYYRNNGWFSKELEEKYDAYQLHLELVQKKYDIELAKLMDLIETNDELYARLPSDTNSMNWEEYGYTELKTQREKYEKLMASCLSGNREEDRIKYYNILNGVNGIVEHQKKREEEIASVDASIKAQEEHMKTITVNTVEFFGTTLYRELSNLFRYTDYIDDTYVGKTNMSDLEILQMQRDLMEKASKELAKVSKPTYTITVNSQNFPAMSKYIKYTEQLYLGNIITIEFEDDTMVEARLLKISFDWENYDNFELVFSSKTSLQDGWFEFAEIQQQASSSSTSQAISGAGWNDAKKQTSIVSDFMNSAFNAAKNKLFAGKNEEFRIDGTGTLWRKWVDEKNDYSPNQMWGTSNGLFLTDSAWASVDTAIGELNLGADEYGNDIIMYGIAAPLLLGKITITEQLYVFNDSGTYSITKDGFIAQNADKTNKLVINPDDNEIFSIYKEKDKVLWFDNSGNAWFKGNITASEITGSKFTCTNGNNTITIDPSSKQLFKIINNKTNESVLYFDELGNGVFQGKITVGAIFSSNWSLTGGNPDGSIQAGCEDTVQGTYINLSNGTFHFGGEHLSLNKNRLKITSEDKFKWAGTTYEKAKRYVTISDEFVKVQFDPEKKVTEGNINMFLTPRGLATGKQATYDPDSSSVNAGIIDFYSTHLKDGHQGITIRTNGSPVCLSSASNVIVLNPHDTTNSINSETGEHNMFAFGINSYNNGQLRYGDYRNNDYNSGLHFLNGKVKITDGGEGLGILECKDISVNGVSLASVMSAMAINMTSEEAE